ncbi:nucleotide sugar dehydrogenase [Rhodovulum marinum]|uniref:UDP-glucose 6-dehydrogenase n=1 Tax=Rhodovulum marinum TaxID=320662 RepID=A0A4R2Q5X9_9RHOB|nr:nucleotide sugar dehydrogenase [Rhodovulum marinum]TCP44212.1 GDP-mannose 6-dehydrogenase [Rhodovulum marinum]
MTEFPGAFEPASAALVPVLHEARPAISVIGLGYVGAVSCGCLTDLGHRVIGVDLDAAKAASVAAGRAPMHEAGLDDLLGTALDKGILSTSTEVEAAVLATDVTFVSVGTPSRADGRCDLTNVVAVAESIGAALARKAGYHAVVMRCSIPPGTTMGAFAQRLEAVSGKRAGRDFGIAFCPEFMREGEAVADFRTPPKTVIGATDDRVAGIVAGIFAPVDSRPLHCSIEIAEMVKYVDNVWHATKVCFGNEVGRLAAAHGVDGGDVMGIFCEDRKLNISPAYLRPGFAYGGSCLPKEVRAVCGLARAAGLDLPLIGHVAASNEAHIDAVVERVRATGARRVGVLGLTFKPGTDDLRESPALALIARLRAAGVEVVCHDPVLSPRLFRPATPAEAAAKRAAYPALDGLDLRGSVSGVLDGCDAVVLTQNAPEYRAALAGCAPRVIDVTGA